jgi:hypothetical protein
MKDFPSRIGFLRMRDAVDIPSLSPSVANLNRSQSIGLNTDQLLNQGLRKDIEISTG